MSKSPDRDPKFYAKDATHMSEEVLATGEFVSLEKYTYKDHDGSEKTWEVATRIAKPLPENPDTVGTLAVLRRMLKYDCLILVKQYRPALKQYTLEFPAGLVNTAEDPDETAMRELREETGYICTGVKHVSPMLSLLT